MVGQSSIVVLGSAVVDASLGALRPMLKRGQFNMDRRRLRRNTKVLWGLILLAMAYGSWLHYLHTLTGTNMLDGSIGVLLGLYICSHPAANAVDLLFFERNAFHQISSEWTGIGWLALNMLVLLVGWIVIVIGATRLAGGGALG